MLSRRTFLTTSGLAAAGAACAQPGAGAATSSGASDLPAPIASLTPMKDGVTPISVDERKGRLERARALMAEHKIDALMLTGGTSMVYSAASTSACCWWMVETPVTGVVSLIAMR